MEKRPELCSIVACLASDPALGMVDFDMFDVKVWRVAKHRLETELGLTLHIVVVARAVAGIQMPPWALISTLAPHGNIEQHHVSYHCDSNSALYSGNSRHKCTCMLFG